MTRRLALAVAVLVLAACSGGGEERAGDAAVPVGWRLSHITSDTSSWHRGGERFAELVAERLPGHRVEVFAFGQLANRDQKTELQMARTGSIDLLLVSPIILALNLDPRWDAFSLPWLFPDHATARAVVEGEMGRTAMSWLDEKGLVGLGWGVNGFRQLTNDERPVRTPADLEGLKLRVAGTRIFLDTFEALGGNALTMNFGEVFSALEQGVVDGQENPLSIIHSSRFQEVQDHVTLWNYAYDPLILAANPDRFARLSVEEQAVFRSAAVEAMGWQAALVEREDGELVAALREAGMEVVELTPDEREAFRAKATPIYEKYRAEIGPRIVDGIQQAVQQAGASP